MKKNGKKWIGLMLVFALALGIAGCGRRGSDGDAESGTGTERMTEEGTTAAPETEVDWSDHPYGVKGLDVQQEDLGNGLVRLASLSADAQIADGYLSLDSVYAIDGHQILFSSSVNETPMNFYGDEGDAGYDYVGDEGEDYWEENYYYESFIVLYDYQKKAVRKKLTLVNSNDITQYSEQVGERLAVWTMDEEKRSAELYDTELNSLGSICLPADVYGEWGSDGAYYVLNEHQIQCYTASKMEEDTFSTSVDVPVNAEFAVDGLNGVIQGEDGVRYALVTGIGSDLRSYSKAVMNLESGELAYLNTSQSGYMYTANNSMIYVLSNDVTQRMDIYSGGTVMEYVTDMDPYPSIEVLNDGRVLIHRIHDEENGAVLEFLIWDGTNGEMLGSVSLEREGGYSYLLGTPQKMSQDGSIFLMISRGESDIDFFRWTPEVTVTSEGAGVTVREAELPDTLVPDLEDMWNPANLSPKPLTGSMLELREEADELEEQMGCEIYIGTEVLGIRGGYAMLDCSEYEIVSEALGIIEKEVSKYPGGFFAQLSEGSSYLTGMDIYLTGTLKGVDEWSLDYAGGFRAEEENRLILAIDCGGGSDIISTFHHEVCHAMETHVVNMADWEADVFGEAWDALNPENVDLYTYTYQEFGTEETMQYAYMYNGWEYENAWVVDDYSLTYPSEDRSRLFEHIMVDDPWIRCWESPYMKAKLEYMFEQYRLYFDLGEEETYWEQVVG